LRRSQPSRKAAARSGSSALRHVWMMIDGIDSERAPAPAHRKAGREFLLRLYSCTVISRGSRWGDMQGWGIAMFEAYGTFVMADAR
jgi:hypothetical protein